LSFLSFNNFYLTLTPIILIFYIWLFFFKINNSILNNTKTLNINVKKLKLKPEELINGIYKYITKLIIISFYNLHGSNDVILYNHFFISNFTLCNYILFIYTSYFVFFLVFFIKKDNLTKAIDYFFSINNLLLFLPLLFYINNVLTFLFFIETLSVLIFYKLISSKI